MKRRTLVLLISILTTTFLWILLDLYHAYNESFFPVIPQSYLEEISPDLDLSAVKLLKKK